MLREFSRDRGYECEWVNTAWIWVRGDRIGEILLPSESILRVEVVSVD